MSEHADKYNSSHRKERVEHVLNSTKGGKVDASGYEVPGELHTEEKTGPCQPKPRAFAKGGKVEGHKAHHHAGRKSRGTGGPTAAQQLAPNVPTGGLYGSGFQPTHAGLMAGAGGLKKGGIANEVTGVRITGDRKARADGGAANFHATRPGDTTRSFPSYEEAHRFAMREGDRNKLWQISPRPEQTPSESLPPSDRKARSDGGKAQRHNGESKAEYRIDEQDRKARAEGGRAGKGKTNINIIIGGPKEDKPPMGPPMGPPMPPPGRPPIPPGAMGAMQPPGMGGGPAGAGGPPPMPPQMPPGAGR